MDALSLLCNLHADGSSSRRRLAVAGLRSLADLAGSPAADLARALGASEEIARRLQREAAALGRRVEEPELAAISSSGPTAVTASGPVDAGAPRSAAKLVPGALPGLDHEACDRLGSAGVHTFAALAERASAAFARELEMPFARLLDLSLAARESLRDPLPAAPGPRVAAAPRVEWRPTPARGDSTPRLAGGAQLAPCRRAP